MNKRMILVGLVVMFLAMVSPLVFAGEHPNLENTGQDFLAPLFSILDNIQGIFTGIISTLLPGIDPFQITLLMGGVLVFLALSKAEAVINLVKIGAVILILFVIVQSLGLIPSG